MTRPPTTTHCVKCKAPRTRVLIKARKLCVSCYNTEQKAGTLKTNFPLVRRMDLILDEWAYFTERDIQSDHIAIILGISLRDLWRVIGKARKLNDPRAIVRPSYRNKGFRRRQ